MIYMKSVQSVGPTGLGHVNSQSLTINSTIMFTFSRLSTERDVPLISRVIISNVSNGLNGVEVSCRDAAMSNSATTAIHLIQGRLLHGNFCLKWHK